MSSFSVENASVNVLIIGGGFYGCALALYLKRELQVDQVLVIEQEPKLLSRASFANQARLHNGYHYPRSFTTAYRSRVNFVRFLREHPSCIVDNFESLYCIARASHVSSRQFEKMCRQIGAKLFAPLPAQERLFSHNTIESIYRVEEFAFDTCKLSEAIARDLSSCGIKVLLGTRAVSAEAADSQHVTVVIANSDGRHDRVRTRRLLNCTYAGLNRIAGGFGALRTELKFELAELALLEMPDVLRNTAITVMDGPFFSVMPFPGTSRHSLSHVRYTPHFSWSSRNCAVASDPYLRLHDYCKITRVGEMIRDASRYVPSLKYARYDRSLFEVKTVLVRNEVDDGRPILFERHDSLPGTVSILGGKIDNIYDARDMLKRFMKA